MLSKLHSHLAPIVMMRTHRVVIVDVEEERQHAAQKAQLVSTFLSIFIGKRQTLQQNIL